MIRILHEYYIIKKSGLFDSQFYLSSNPDVRIAGINPLMHFIKAGWKEKRNPCEYFDTEFYLDSNEDVEKAQINPLVHYIKNGWKEGRKTAHQRSVFYRNKSSKAEKLFFLFKELCKNPVLLKKFFKTFFTKGYRSTIEKMFFYYSSNKSRFELESSFMGKNYFGFESLDYKFTEIDNNPFCLINVEKFDYFLFDVFDTALIRLFFRPEDVFKYISYKKNEKEFASKRVGQEISARKRKPLQKDIRLTDIYEGLEDSYNIKDEIEAENRFCVANPQVLRFYSDLIEAGKKIYFISDMYLDKKTISGLLEKNGYNIYEDIFVSSEDDLIKGDGSRYEWLKIHFPDISGRAVMIGDNIISDYEQPKAFGYDSFHYLDNESFYRLDPFLNSGINFLKSNESLGLSMIFSVFRYWKLSFNDNFPLYWRQFGFFYGGALVCSFCKYVHDYVLENKPSCKKVFFMGRDGDIMNKVFRILFDKSDIESVHVLASRRSFVFPALTDLSTKNDKNELLNFIRPQNVKGAKTILERIGYFDLSELEKDLNSIGKEPCMWSSDDIHYCLKKNRNSIIEKVKNERKILFDYLTENNFFGQRNLIIADVGWGGSIQTALAKLLKLWGFEDVELTGLYFGVNDSAFEKNSMKGFLFDKDFEAQIFYEKYVNLMELLCSSPMDPIDKFENKEGSIVSCN
ncbi:MAG: hypothetical protein H6680_05300 [Desulfobacteraceae bacterium]|nr:hypothetical protein [Desulfobacteraceae bacterium]